MLIYETAFAQLLTNLESHVDGADAEQGRRPRAQRIVMHGHLGEVDGHFFDEQVLDLLFL